MRVLLINVVCGIRSTGRLCTDLAEALEAQGHEVKIAYGRERVPQQFQKYAVRIGSDIDNKIHGLQARLMDGAGFGSKRATRAFLEKVREFDPDVIHLHNLHGYYLNIEELFFYLKSCGKRIIWTLHDCWAFSGHSATCDAAGCRKWISGCGHCPELGSYPKSLTDHSAANWKRKRDAMKGVPDLSLVTPSEWLAGLTRESFLSEYPVSVIRNGIDTSRFRPVKNDFRERYGIEDKFMLLGAATSWSDRKGLADFLRLSELLGDEYQIVLVGVTSKQKKSLPERIIGIERTDSVEELACIYSAADLYLNLSYCENYPTTNLEAMTCNTPVLTYQTGGSPESVLLHQGIVVDKGDLNAVIEAVAQYKAESSGKPELSCAGEFDKRLAARQYAAYYEGLPQPFRLIPADELI